jgi:uncharacterized protein YaeQ
MALKSTSEARMMIGRVAKARGRSGRVVVYTYSASPELWQDPIADGLAKVKRSLDLSATIQDGELWLRDEDGREARLSINPIR